MKLRILTGIGFGCLLGLLLGLSVSDVVAAFLTAAVAIAAVVLGVAPLPDKGVRPDQPQLAAFAIACASFILVGIFLRTHNVLGISTNAQIGAVTKWVKAGIPSEYAALIVTGVAPPRQEPPPSAQSPASTTNSRTTPPGISTRELQQRAILGALSSNASAASACSNLDPTQIQGADNRIRTLDANGFSLLAERLKRAPENERDELYQAAWKLLCK